VSDMLSAVHVSEDDVQLYVRGHLELGHISALESHLLECQTCRELLSQGLGLELRLHALGRTKAAEKYKRSEPRFNTGDDAILQELSPLSLDRHKVKIVNVSRNGLGILAPKSSWPGTLAQVRIKNNVELGEVRHCSPLGDNGYRLGLLLYTRF